MGATVIQVVACFAEPLGVVLGCVKVTIAVQILVRSLVAVFGSVGGRARDFH